jgi:hypothetical protein
MPGSKDRSPIETPHGVAELISRSPESSRMSAGRVALYPDGIARYSFGVGFGEFHAASAIATTFGSSFERSSPWSENVTMVGL